MSAPNLQTEWARLLLGTLRAAGVREAVISPGGRSTPFTWAALETAGLRCRTLIDERSAAFFAVGHARLTGEPVLLICTSGSAAANYLPAVVEASESGTPLLVLTADRGLELQQAAAPQTVDQIKLFGDHVRDFFELGSPDAHPRMLGAVRRMAAQAALATRSPVPGPVHLNARARKPLEPVAADGPAAEAVRAAVDALLEGGAPASHDGAARPSADGIRALADACRSARRGLIVCGPTPPADGVPAVDLAALARATGFPVAAEPASQARFDPGIDGAHWIDGFATLLSVPPFRERAAPDLVLQLGRPPTAAAWGGAFNRWPDTTRYVIAPHGWPDPWSTATAVVRGPVRPTIAALVEALDGAGGGPRPDDAAAAGAAWLDELARANRTAWRVIDEAVADGLSEGAAVRAAIDAVPDGGVLALGNSLPIREAEMFAPAAARPVTVWAQRGANGIDGLISGAAGAAVAAGRPTTLIIGDVSFVHDVGGLAAAREVAAPFTIVVLNNGGGRIFERLPLGDRVPAEAMDAWLTPPPVDITAAAAAFGLAHARATDRAGLARALEEAAGRPGATVVEAVIEAGGTTAHQRDLLRRLETELEA